MFPSLLPTYNRTEVAFVRGEGPYLFAEDGQRYLDFTAGIAVNAFGHANPRLVAALTEQAGKLWHTSNLFRVPGQEALSKRLTEVTFADTCFFTNSGVEACELAWKMARRYQFVSGHPEKFRIICFEGAFHGRTMAAIAAGGNPKYLEGFGPKVEGFDTIPPGDIEAVKAAIGPETAAILIEPIQGEGGVRVLTSEYLKGLRKLCDDNGLLLIFDEVQCGVGRTGKLFAYEWHGITPDIMPIAKAIGGGFPVGACLATAEAAKGMTAGTHGTTYGGNPLAMAVAKEALEMVLEPDFLPHVVKIANYLQQQLGQLLADHPTVFEEVRGQGLLLGLKMKVPNTEFVAVARKEQHLLLVGAGDNVIRLLPPLIIEEAHVREAVEKLSAAAKTFESNAK
ncbi:acetylornithine/N-succinyldiaminopimelate aminotransferase [Rhizomicrobium palustre]|uniref:Acetylornithine aminotransferase n=1 Tax=Rhizomicrobium palustre TaxID=189966 RepID=A0A846MZD8_9PROT|nr:acetylornithine/N-succinyldiaminopimelate aminotransferase [Rhizomicrobium palustre]